MITFGRMTILYYSPGAASMLVHWLLLELGIAHELRALDFATREHKRPAYRALNPSGVVPTLVLDGRPMTEAAAIAMPQADTQPLAGLAPGPDAPARGAYLPWMLHTPKLAQPLSR